jgi:2-keto-myo-inositol isomerase
MPPTGSATSQIATLRAKGYSGPISFEAFSPEIHALADPESALRRSIAFIEEGVAAVRA